ncbi:unnamed protein product [Phaeothamnion confervicola]
MRRICGALLVAGSVNPCRAFSFLPVHASQRRAGGFEATRHAAQPKPAVPMQMEAGKLWDFGANGRVWLAGAMAGVALAAGVALGPEAAFASSSAEVNKGIAVCLLKSCQAELGQCILNPKCLANLICLQTCVGKDDETACQIRCGDLFENPTVGKFNACAVSAKKCVPQKQDDATFPEPPGSSLVKSFDPKVFDGRWYITAGLNPIFDIFDCQVHFFTSPEPGKVFGKLNWRIKEPDGEFFTRDTIQRFVQSPKNPAILLNHDNEYLHYEDDWYILDYEPNNFVLVYYRGRNDAWVGYGGSVLYTRTPTVPAALKPRLREAAARANLNWDDFKETDNSCKVSPADRDAALLRTEYANKLFLMEEQQLQEQLTALRGFAGDQLSASEKGAEGALATLEELRETYQNEISFGVVELEDTVGQELQELAAGAEAEVEVIKDVVVKPFENQFFNFLNKKTLDNLSNKVEVPSAP